MPYVDIFLADLKFCSSDLSLKYCLAPDYFEKASEAISFMVKNKPLIIKNNTLKQGVIIRHLVMPNCNKDSKLVLDFISTNFGNNVIFSLMSQYTPYFNAEKFPEINRKLTPLEYKSIVRYAIKLKIENCYTQDLTSSGEKCIPIFNLKGTN